MSTTFHSYGKWLEDMRVVGIAKPVAPSGVSVRAPCSMALRMSCSYSSLDKDLRDLGEQRLQQEVDGAIVLLH